MTGSRDNDGDKILDNQCVHFAAYSQLLPLHSMHTNLQSVEFHTPAHCTNTRLFPIDSMDTRIVTVTLVKNAILDLRWHSTLDF